MLDCCRSLVRLAVLFAPALLTGCILQATLGHTIFDGTDDGLAHTTLESRSTTSACESTGSTYPGSSPAQHNCSYSIGGAFFESLFGLSSELGLFGVFLDPVILQVPADARGFAATFTGAATGSITVTELVGGFDADSGTHINPEPGQKFVVLDFPSHITPSQGQEYSFRLTFRQARTAPPLEAKSTHGGIKAMFTGRVTVGGKTFYPPLLPCVSDFAEIPPLILPVAASPQPLTLPVDALHGCTSKAYGFFPSVLETADVVEYYHAGLDHYFVTLLAAEADVLDLGTQIRGWTRTGRTFKTYPSPAAGTTPVCRYYLPPEFGDSHFYGRGTAECDATGQQHPGFVLESSTFMHMRLPNAAGRCPSGTVPVYRVFSNRADANHRYMTDLALRNQMVAAGWVAEGDGPDAVVMCGPT